MDRYTTCVILLFETLLTYSNNTNDIIISIIADTMDLDRNCA